VIGPYELSQIGRHLAVCPAVSDAVRASYGAALTVEPPDNGYDDPWFDVVAAAWNEGSMASGAALATG